MRIPRTAVVVPILGLFVLASAAAQGVAEQQSGRSVERPLAPIAVAARAEQGSPSVDGVLDDPAWQSARPITAFTQVEPSDGAEPTERTEIRVVYSDAALYIGARMFDSDPAGIEGRLGRRDSYTS
ncbi:MAG: hypothetical protein OER89_12845, partial [Gemmatimonadota bacterium]|nr:hypothetical protein [Gemmatimonadota bacterium]